jgi:uncharacterized protein YecT (DUF1311 family)
MIRIVLAIAALLFIASPVAAAGFDCSKAQSSFEKAICSSPELSQEDDILAQAYQTALGGLSVDAADEVKSAQRAWLTYAQHSCSDDAQPITGAYTDDQTDCLTGIYRDRVRDLEASRMQGGYRFYPLDRYLVEKDTDALPEDFVKVADRQFQIVKIDSAGEVATAFNAAIDTLIKGTPNIFEPGTMTIGGTDGTSDDDISTKVSDVTSERISLQTNEYWYGHGAAHGNYFITNRHFLVHEKRLLEASDIFEGDDWQERLGQQALDAIKAKLGEDFYASSDEDVKAIAVDPLRWDFSEEGLIVQFNIYEVTAYAMGAPTVIIPWDELSAITTDRAEEIAYY